jgi:cytochrome c-type biogenesis protein CcmE
MLPDSLREGTLDARIVLDSLREGILRARNLLASILEAYLPLNLIKNTKNHLIWLFFYNKHNLFNH